MEVAQGSTTESPMVGLRKELEALPQDPVSRAHPRNWTFRAKRALDFIGHARPHHARFWRRVNPFPKPFRHCTFRTEDGVQIAAWIASGTKPGGAGGANGPTAPFGLVIVPGMFSTKDDTVHKRRAIHMHRNWKVPVIVIDQRAFGESTGIATAGWKEALDVHAAAKFLAEESGVDRIGVLAESLGGAASLNALAHDSRSGTDLFSGGLLLFSAFVDTRDAVHYITAEPPKDHPFYAAWQSFRRLLLFRSMGGYQSFEEYLDDAARVNGLRDVEELYDLANPKWKVGMWHQPVLLVHAADDPVVPVRHARRMERYARGYDDIQVIVTQWGGHTAFEAMDPWWFWEVTRRFFGTVNGVELANLAGGGRREIRPAPVTPKKGAARPKRAAKNAKTHKPRAPRGRAARATGKGATDKGTATRREKKAKTE